MKFARSAPDVLYYQSEDSNNVGEDSPLEMELGRLRKETGMTSQFLMMILINSEKDPTLLATKGKNYAMVLINTGNIPRTTTLRPRIRLLMV